MIKEIFVIFTLEVQDGENRYKLNSPQRFVIDTTNDLQTQINEVGEDLAKNYLSEQGTQVDNSDWYEVEGGCRMIRYTSFEVIENKDIFDLISNILYK